MPKKIEKLYSISEIADQWLIWFWKRTIEKLIKEKKLKSIIINPNSKKVAIRVPKSSILEYLDKNSIDNIDNWRKNIWFEKIND